MCSPVKNVVTNEELTLFGTISSSDCDVSSVSESMVEELERNLADIIDESFADITEGKMENNVSLDKIEQGLSSVVEVARTKQTSHKDQGGLLVATRGMSGMGTAGGGGSSKNQTPLPAKPPKKRPPPPGGKEPRSGLKQLVKGHHYVPYEQTMVAKLAHENQALKMHTLTETASGYYKTQPIYCVNPRTE